MKSIRTKKKFNIYLIIFFVFFVLNCTTKKYVIYNAVSGTVVDSINGKPLKDVKR